MGARAALARLVLTIALASSAGCVHYVPVAMDEVRPDEEVHVSVGREAASRMLPHLGAAAGELPARVAPRGADSTAITVWLGRDYAGTPFENVRRTIVVGRDEVIGLRRRELSAWRTAALALAVTAGFIWMTDRVVPWLPDGSDSAPVPYPPGPSGASPTRTPVGVNLPILLGRSVP